MHITKCDSCKKTIKHYDEGVSAGFGTGMARATFCDKCGKPIADFLKRNKIKNPYEKED